MKIAVSLPDELFEQAESCARGQHVSRSALIAAALREYMQRHRVPMDPTAAWNAAIDAHGQPGDDPAANLARRRSKRVVRQLHP
jgi:metal-responsive CopG/Arc/MetJ family transcriptional regulator